MPELPATVIFAVLLMIGGILPHIVTKKSNKFNKGAGNRPRKEDNNE
jgi:hypothetical protein